MNMTMIKGNTLEALDNGQVESFSSAELLAGALDAQAAAVKDTVRNAGPELAVLKRALGELAPSPAFYKGVTAAMIRDVVSAAQAFGSGAGKSLIAFEYLNVTLKEKEPVKRKPEELNELVASLVARRSRALRAAPELYPDFDFERINDRAKELRGISDSGAVSRVLGRSVHVVHQAE
jgi:hypothetical protein